MANQYKVIDEKAWERVFDFCDKRCWSNRKQSDLLVIRDVFYTKLKEVNCFGAIYEG